MTLAAGLSLAPDIARLRSFVTNFADLLADARDQSEILEIGGTLLARLVSRDDWLPEPFARPRAERYQQYLLHCDSRERFSVVSFVWNGGQGTPIHDHRVWGLVGVLRGAERVEHFERRINGALEQVGPTVTLGEAEVEAIDPRHGDIHRVANAYADAPSISIHVYGGNIGAIERATYDPDGTPRPFISGYANSVVPHLWDGSERT
jgi:predicted metal-dependent enzyme (double-stranded beta helix superfamily)